MTESPEPTRLDEIRRRLSENAYFLNPHSDVNVREDMAYLLELLAQKEKSLAQQEKKGAVLSQQILELTQEIENIRSDFDSHR